MSAATSAGLDDEAHTDPECVRRGEGLWGGGFADLL